MDPTKESLLLKALKSGVSIKEIRYKFGVNSTTINKLLIKHHISRPEKGGRKCKLTNRDIVDTFQECLRSRKTKRQILDDIYRKYGADICAPEDKEDNGYVRWEHRVGAALKRETDEGRLDHNEKDHSYILVETSKDSRSNSSSKGARNDQHRVIHKNRAGDSDPLLGIATLMDKLKGLLDDGAISEDEYNKKIAILLNKIK